MGRPSLAAGGVNLCPVRLSSVALSLGIVVGLLAIPVAVSPPTGLSLAQAQEPVLEAPPAEEEAGDDAWTFRFLVPTAIVLSTIVVVVVVILYGVRVRGRYRVKQ